MRMQRRISQHENRLWIARKKSGLRQKVVARLLGHKSKSPISEYENGRLLPSLRTAFKLAIIYQVSLQDLYGSLYDQVKDEIEASTKKGIACRETVAKA